MGSEGKKAVRLRVARCRFSIFHNHFVAPSENIFFFFMLMRFQLKSRTVQMLDSATFETDENTLIFWLILGVRTSDVSDTHQ